MRCTELDEVIKEKYTQLCLARRFGGINTIGFTHTLCNIYLREVLLNSKHVHVLVSEKGINNGNI